MRRTRLEMETPPRMLSRRPKKRPRQRTRRRSWRAKTTTLSLTPSLNRSLPSRPFVSEDHLRNISLKGKGFRNVSR